MTARIRKGFMLALLCASFGYTEEPQKAADLRVVVGPQEDVFRNYAFGLTDFPDGLIGVTKKEGTYYLFVGGFAPDDRTKTYLFRFVGKSLDRVKPDALNKRGKAIPVLRPGPKGFYDDHIAGNGSVYRDERTGRLYFWYQAMREIPEQVVERKKAGRAAAYVYPAYSTIGLAVSDDLGKTWVKKGADLQLHLTWDIFITHDDIPQADSYPPAVVKQGEYLYMYYADYLADNPVPRITAARLSLSEVGKFPHPWKKYYKDAFQESALGGRFTPVLESDASAGRWTGAFPAVSYNTYLKKWLMVHCGAENPLYWRTSSDGLHWSEPRILARDPNAKNWYMVPTIVGIGEDPSVSGQEFWVYYAYAPNERADPGGWMVRRKVSLPKPMKEYVESQVNAGSYSTPSEYLRTLIREDQNRKKRDRIEALLLESMNSGEPIEMNKAYWEKKHRELLG